MEVRVLLETFTILNPKKYEKDLDKLLDRINEIDKILADQNKQEYIKMHRL